MTAHPLGAQTAKPLPLNLNENEVSEATRRQAEGPMRFILQMDAAKERKDKAPAAKPAPAATPASAAAASAKPKAAAPTTTATNANGPAAAKPAEASTSAQPATADSPPLAKAAPAPEATPTPTPSAAPALAAAVLTPPTLVSMVEPDISSASRRRLQGAQSATVRLSIAADGSVSDAEVLKVSNAVLRQPVLDAIKQWRYTPPGQAVSQTVELQLVDAE